MVFGSAAGACSAKTRDIMAKNPATAYFIQKYTTSRAVIGQPLRFPGRAGKAPAVQPSVRRWTLKLFRVTVTLQPPNFLYGQFRYQRFRAHRAQRPSR